MLKMSEQLKKGDLVKLISVPEWLVHDLPADEQHEIRSCVGMTTQITDIDSSGYFWIGFGDTHDAADSAQYGGHTFCVPRECLEAVS